MMHDHQVLIPAAFVSRPNRFVTKAVMGDAVVTCHMPNPGRMWELLYEGTRLYLRKAKDPARKTPYDVVGIERDGVPILLDTPLTNAMRLEKAITTYLRGLPKDLAQTYRDEVIDCSVEDIRALAPVVRDVLSDGYRCVVGSKEAIEENKDVFEKIFKA